MQLEVAVETAEKNPLGGGKLPREQILLDFFIGALLARIFKCAACERMSIVRCGNVLVLLLPTVRNHPNFVKIYNCGLKLIQVTSVVYFIILAAITKWMQSPQPGFRVAASRLIMCWSTYSIPQSLQPMACADV